MNWRARANRRRYVVVLWRILWASKIAEVQNDITSHYQQSEPRDGQIAEVPVGAIAV